MNNPEQEPLQESENELEEERVVQGLIRVYVNIAGLGIVLTSLCLFSG